MKNKNTASLIIILFLLLFPLSSYSHSGRTDASGGHYNRSTGEYHYHHDYPAHQHPNGICPYSNSSNTAYYNSNTGNNTENKTNTINDTINNTINSKATSTSINTTKSTTENTEKKHHYWLWAIIVILIIETFDDFARNKFKNKKQSDIIDIKPEKVETIETTNIITPPTPTRNYYTCPRCR